MDLLSRPVLPPDHRISYGSDPSQFGDLWLPEPRYGSPSPLIVFFHGGWWKSAYDLGYAGYLCAALKKDGIACWSVEYRRVGDTGGGWPNTFRDAALGLEYVSTLARSFPIDITRVSAMGHSAGGHLAFWLGGRHHLDPHGDLYNQAPKVPLKSLISLAGAVDLRLTIDLAGYFTYAHDKQEVYNLMGGSPSEHPERFAQGSPADLLPFNTPQILLQGSLDDQIPPTLPGRWADLSRRAGDPVTFTIIPGAGHFDVVDPESPAWPTVRKEILKIV